MQPDWQQYINQELGKPYRWEAFAKGSSNTLYRGQFDDDDVVLRKNGTTSETPGVSRDREALLLNLISTYQWAPDIIDNRVSEDWCVMRCYSPLNDGSPSEIQKLHLPDDSNKPEQTPAANNSSKAQSINDPVQAQTTPLLSNQQQAQLVKAISDLQNILLKTTIQDDEYSKLKINYQQTWDTAYLPQALARNDQQSICWIKEINQHLETLPLIPESLVHHDLHIGNLALNTKNDTQERDELILLDWEYGGIGNAWLDAAALVNFFNISSEVISTLPVFQQLSNRTFQEGLQQAIELRELINRLWYRARNEI